MSDGSDHVQFGPLPEVARSIIARARDLQAIRERHAEDAADIADTLCVLPNLATPADAAVARLVKMVHLDAERHLRSLDADRTRLLAIAAELEEALGAAYEDLGRLRPIVEGVAVMGIGVNGDGHGDHHIAPSLIDRARAALRPAGTLTSLPVDGDCDGSD